MERFVITFCCTLCINDCQHQYSVLEELYTFPFNDTPLDHKCITVKSIKACIFCRSTVCKKKPTQLMYQPGLTK